MKIFEVEVGVGVCKKLKGSKPEIGGVNFLEGSWLKLTVYTVLGTLTSKNMPFHRMHLLDILIFEILNIKKVINVTQ